MNDFDELKERIVNLSYPLEELQYIKRLYAAKANKFNHNGLSLEDSDFLFNLWAVAYAEKVLGNFDASFKITDQIIEHSKNRNYRLDNLLFSEVYGVRGYVLAAKMLSDKSLRNLGALGHLKSIGTAVLSRSKAYSSEVDKAIAMGAYACYLDESIVYTQEQRDNLLKEARERLFISIRDANPHSPVEELNDKLPIFHQLDERWKLFYKEIKSAPFSAYLQSRKMSH